MRRLRYRSRASRAETTSGRRLLLLAVTMALVLPACSGGLGSFVAPTAAVVGRAAITEQALVTQLKLAVSPTQLASLFQGPQSSLSRLDAKRQVLTQLIQYQAVANEAGKLGVSVGERDVEAAVANTRTR